jgi:hypothetical protein
MMAVHALAAARQERRPRRRVYRAVTTSVEPRVHALALKVAAGPSYCGPWMSGTSASSTRATR